MSEVRYIFFDTVFNVTVDINVAYVDTLYKKLTAAIHKLHLRQSRIVSDTTTSFLSSALAGSSSITWSFRFTLNCDGGNLQFRVSLKNCRDTSSFFYLSRFLKMQYWKIAKECMCRYRDYEAKNQKWNVRLLYISYGDVLYKWTWFRSLWRSLITWTSVMGNLCFRRIISRFSLSCEKVGSVIHSYVIIWWYTYQLKFTRNIVKSSEQMSALACLLWLFYSIIINQPKWR